MTRFPQSNKTAQHVGKLLSNSKTNLGKLMERATYLTQLETMIRGLLNPDLAAQFQVAAVRQNRLVLVTPTAAWATRLRMHAPQLLISLRQNDVADFEYIDVRVAPLVLQTTEKRTKRTLSIAAKQALDQVARLQDNDKD